MWTRKSSLLFWLSGAINTQRHWGNPVHSFASFILPAPTPQGAQSRSSESGKSRTQEHPFSLSAGAVSQERAGTPILSHFCHHLAPHVGTVTGRGQRSGMEHPLSVQRMGVGEGVDTECWEVLGRLQKRRNSGKGALKAVHRLLGSILCCVGVDLSHKGHQRHRELD